MLPGCLLVACLETLMLHDLLLFLGRHLLEVELEFLALKNVAISTSALSRSRRDAGVEAALPKLVFNGAFNDSHGLSALGLLLGGGLADLSLVLTFLALLLTEDHTVVLLVELTERNGVDLHDAVLHEGLGTHKLVVGGVVLDFHNTGLLSDGLRAPRKVAVFKTHSAVLEVTATDADDLHSIKT